MPEMSPTDVGVSLVAAVYVLERLAGILKDFNSDPGSDPWDGEPTGKLAAKISETHDVITASEQDGTRLIYSTRRILAAIQETQDRQQALLEGIHHEIQELGSNGS